MGARGGNPISSCKTQALSCASPPHGWCPCNVNIKTGKSYSVVVLVTGRTVVIKDETGEIPWGHTSSVQKWVRALGYPHCLRLQWRSSSSCSAFLDYLMNVTFHVGFTLVALGFTWLSLDLSHWINFTTLGLFSGLQCNSLDYSVVLMKLIEHRLYKVRLENYFCYIICYELTFYYAFSFRFNLAE